MKRQPSEANLPFAWLNLCGKVDDSRLFRNHVIKKEPCVGQSKAMCVVHHQVLGKKMFKMTWALKVQAPKSHVCSSPLPLWSLKIDREIPCARCDGAARSPFPAPIKWTVNNMYIRARIDDSLHICKRTRRIDQTRLHQGFIKQANLKSIDLFCHHDVNPGCFGTWDVLRKTVTLKQ